MKKILTVALSTAMAFSMFASVAFGDSAVTPQQKFDALAAKGVFNGYPDKQAHLERDMTRAEFAKVLTKLLGLKEVTDGTPSYKDKGYDQKMWAFPYIEAVTAAGIMEGQDKVKGIFNYNGKVTVQEMATVLTRALKLEVPEKVDNTASDWAKKDVQAAINKGLISKDLNFQANATREQLVEAAYAIDQLKNLTVASYKVADNGKDIEFTLNTGEVVKVTLEKALEPNKETEVKFKNAAGQEITAKVTWVVTTATKVEGATADNLKEVVVKFDGEVDKASATDKANYTINEGAIGIKSVTLLNDKKSARVLLDNSYKFTNQVEYKISVRNVKAGDKKISATDVKFAPLDNTLPSVEEAKALGTKALKVTFSEPVKTVTSSNFKLDGAAFYGSVTKSENEREVILKPYGGDYSIGAHKVTVALVEDYAGLKSLSADYDVTVAEDKEGPAVAEVTATLEKATITFNKDIDPASVNNNTFYWLSGSTKQYGVPKQISGTVYEVDFTKNPLPGYETTLHIDSVKDYSGNVNPVKEVKITASVDLVRPQVTDVKFEGNNIVAVKFDKGVNPGTPNNYTIKNSDDKIVPVRSVSTAAGSDYKVVNLEFYSTLAGDYTITVAGVKDRTQLQNVVQDFTGKFTAVDKEQPAASSLDANNASRTIAINFNKEMNRASLENRANYFVGFSSNGTPSGASPIALPSDVTVRAAADGKSVFLVFPEHINGKTVSFPTAKGGNGTVQTISVSAGLQSASGAVLSEFAQTMPVVQQPAEVKSAKQVSNKKLEVTFSQGIASASAYDFKVNNENLVSNVTVDGSKVVLNLTTEVNARTISVVPYSSIVTLVGNPVKETTNFPVQDDAAPVVLGIDKYQTLPRYTENNTVVPYSVYIPFNSNLDKTGEQFYGSDLEVRHAAETGSPVIPQGSYTTTVVDNKLVINFTNDKKDGKNYTGDYTVEIVNNRQIKGVNGVAVEKAGPFRVSAFTGETTPGQTDDIESATYVNGKDEIKSNADAAQFKVTAKAAGTAGDGVKVEVKKPTQAQTEPTVDVKDKVITVTLAGAVNKDDATKIDVTSTVADLIHAIEINDQASKLVEVKATAQNSVLAQEADVTTAGGQDATKTQAVVVFNKKIGSEGQLVITDAKGKDLGYKFTTQFDNTKTKLTITFESGKLADGYKITPVNFKDASGNAITGSATLKK